MTAAGKCNNFLSCEEIGAMTPKKRTAAIKNLSFYRPKIKLRLLLL